MKASIVTGGASGIGLEFVKLLLEDGYKVFIIDNNKKNLRGLTKKLESKNFECIHQDMSKTKSPQKIYDMLKKKDIHVLINNAGFGTFGKFYKTKWEKERQYCVGCGISVEWHLISTYGDRMATLAF